MKEQKEELEKFKLKSVDSFVFEKINDEFNKLSSDLSKEKLIEFVDEFGNYFDNFEELKPKIEILKS